jgi:aquaporin Z
VADESGFAESIRHLLEADVKALAEFKSPSFWWRRLFSELFGTFFLVLVAAGAGMMMKAVPGSVSIGAAVVAPGLMVMAIIMFMGKVSGAHLNPGVSLAFAMRGDFPWRRVPAYVFVQLAGAVLAAWFLQSTLDVSAVYGATLPAAHHSALAAFLMEMVLTLGLISVILGTASGAQNVGIIGALAIGGYIALAGLWGNGISGASMNTARSFGPALISGDFTAFWVYVAGPLAGMVLALWAAMILRGPGGGRSGSTAAQGTLDTVVEDPSDE